MRLIISASVLVLSHMIHYGYYNYNMIKPDYNIYKLNFFLMFLGFYGLATSIDSVDNLTTLSIICIIYMSTINMMYQDVRFLKSERNKPYKLELHNPDTILLINILGWIILMSIIPANSVICVTGATCIAHIIGKRLASNLIYVVIFGYMLSTNQ